MNFRNSLVDLADKTRKENREFAVCICSDESLGEVVKGERGEIPPSKIAKAIGSCKKRSGCSIYIHTHPSTAEFSPEDLLSLIVTGRDGDCVLGTVGYGNGKKPMAVLNCIFFDGMSEKDKKELGLKLFRAWSRSEDPVIGYTRMLDVLDEYERRGKIKRVVIDLITGEIFEQLKMYNLRDL